MTLTVPVGRENRVGEFLACPWLGVIKQGFVTCPTAVIDDRVLWYAPPLMAETTVGRRFPSPHYLCARLEAPGLLPRLAYMTRLSRHPDPKRKSLVGISEQESEVPRLRRPHANSQRKADRKIIFGLQPVPFLYQKALPGTKPPSRFIRFLPVGSVNKKVALPLLESAQVYLDFYLFPLPAHLKPGPFGELVSAFQGPF